MLNGHAAKIIVADPARHQPHALDEVQPQNLEEMRGGSWNGAPGRIRTSDHLVRSQVLYPAELRARNVLIYRDFKQKTVAHPFIAKARIVHVRVIFGQKLHRGPGTIPRERRPTSREAS